MSGVDLPRMAAQQIRKGAADAIRKHVEALGGSFPPTKCCTATTRRAAAARRWWWPTARKVLGVVELKDIVKGGIKERFAELRRMGIKTVMITGDNR
jgi:K+-transporting ATPase ATPase B chain